MKLENKVAIITGGAQGLGRAFAEELLKKEQSISYSFKVCICDVNVTKGREVVAILQQTFGQTSASFVSCDVTDHDSFENVFKDTVSQFGSVDIVVNNAGLGMEGDGWQRTIHVNMIGVIDGTKLAVEYMSKENGGKGGVVVNVASLAGLDPVYIFPVYVGSKHGIVGYTRSMAANPEVHQSGIRFVCLCPGATDTEGYKDGLPQSLERGVKMDEVQKLAKETGVNTVEDVAAAFMQLVETDNNNGGVMSVMKKSGIEYRHGKPLTD